MPHEYLSLEKERALHFIPTDYKLEKEGKKKKECLFFFMRNIY